MSLPLQCNSIFYVSICLCSALSMTVWEVNIDKPNILELTIHSCKLGYSNSHTLTKIWIMFITLQLYPFKALQLNSLTVYGEKMSKVLKMNSQLTLLSLPRNVYPHGGHLLNSSFSCVNITSGTLTAWTIVNVISFQGGHTVKTRPDTLTIPKHVWLWLKPWHKQNSWSESSRDTYSPQLSGYIPFTLFLYIVEGFVTFTTTMIKIELKKWCVYVLLMRLAMWSQ